MFTFLFTIVFVCLNSFGVVAIDFGLNSSQGNAYAWLPQSVSNLLLKSEHVFVVREVKTVNVFWFCDSLARGVGLG